ncbi:hypothetical protein [Lacisediminihabitans changchengi]|uniref:Uncharacterized protein n=1 Tax=Lacisediminihabitans changchengi TaxID=2787634 RepID=A0A934W2J2_9MICO|nr:hypothetical protein [Lacisediminihabitans changchengi]MBK4346904.1 hypothetical protein [Lacisediminihabitans changchengi]MBK4347973.1 hypothetical protein [Lacisediminihabitans changchengi]
MAEKLNDAALQHARSLVRDGKVVRDKHAGWAAKAPTAAEENAFIEKHGWAEYEKWHLGVDETASEQTKGRFSFPYGDFSRVDRGAVIAIESRAAEYDHDDIATAAKNLLELIDEE